MNMYSVQVRAMVLSSGSSRLLMPAQQPSFVDFPQREFGKTRVVKCSFKCKRFQRWSWQHYNEDQHLAVYYVCRCLPEKSTAICSSIASRTKWTCCARDGTSILDTPSGSQRVSILLVWFNLEQQALCHCVIIQSNRNQYDYYPKSWASNDKPMTLQLTVVG